MGADVHGVCSGGNARLCLRLGCASVFDYHTGQEVTRSEVAAEATPAALAAAQAGGGGGGGGSGSGSGESGESGGSGGLCSRHVVDALQAHVAATGRPFDLILDTVRTRSALAQRSLSARLALACRVACRGRGPCSSRSAASLRAACAYYGLVAYTQACSSNLCSRPCNPLPHHSRLQVSSHASDDAAFAYERRITARQGPTIIASPRHQVRPRPPVDGPAHGPVQALLLLVLCLLSVAL